MYYPAEWVGFLQEGEGIMTTESEEATGPDFVSTDGESGGTGLEHAPSIDAPQTGDSTDDERGAEMVAALEALTDQVARFHERSERQEQIVRAMQDRISSLQGDQILALLKPALLRFARLHAQAEESAVRARGRGEEAEKDFAFFATSVEEALGLLDLDSIGAEAGAPFDSTRHAATEAVATADPALDRTIARVVRQGFTYPDAKRVTLPAQVTVYRFDETLEAADELSTQGRTAYEAMTDDQNAGATSTDDTEEH